MKSPRSYGKPQRSISNAAFEQTTVSCLRGQGIESARAAGHRRARWLRPSTHFCRRISRVLCMDSLSVAISPSSREEVDGGAAVQRRDRSWSPLLSSGATSYRRSGSLWISDHDTPEWVITIPEQVITMGRNTQ